MTTLLLALLLTQLNPKPKPAVYAYHSTTHCEGLAWCSIDTKKMTEAQQEARPLPLRPLPLST